jgi:preprotein translocase subunit YajC
MNIAAIASLAAATPAKPTTNSAGSIIFLVVVFALLFVMYRTFMRPRQRAAQAQRDTLLTLEPGDEVLTGAGIFGTVQHVQGDRVTLWTGTGSTITVLKRTIVRKIDEDDPDYEAEPEHGEGESWNDDDTAALEAHNSDGSAPDDGESEPAQGSASGPAGDGVARLGASDNGASTSAATDADKTSDSSKDAGDVANDGHLADRIDELTAPEHPSEDKDR